MPRPDRGRRAPARCAAGLAAAALLAAWPAAATPAPTVVLVAQQGADPLTERALDAIAAGLGDLPVALVQQRIEGWDGAIVNRVEYARGTAAATGAIAVIWLDLAAPQHVFLFIADATGGRILVRSVRAEGQDPEAQIETLAVIVHGSIKGLLAGGRIGVEAPAPARPAAPPAERLGASAGYALQLYAPTEPVVHGIRLAVTAGLSRWLFVAAGYRLDLPLQVETAAVAADIWPHPIELGLFGRWRFDRWSLDAGAVAVADVVTFTVSSRDPGVDAVRPGPQVAVAVSPFLRVARAMGGMAAAFFGVGLDVAVYNHRYVVARPDGDGTVVAPWRVRPMFELGARFTML